jgi:hypothetical protein
MQPWIGATATRTTNVQPCGFAPRPLSLNPAAARLPLSPPALPAVCSFDVRMLRRRATATVHAVEGTPSKQTTRYSSYSPSSTLRSARTLPLVRK